jgi:hypothetical protein
MGIISVVPGVAADKLTPGSVKVWTGTGSFYLQGSFLLNRDIDPASNDNEPMWLNKAA